ncbi:MAG: hypothetical protein Q8L48_05615 [Archangium sp.]|nr:hypothetical protein [Archangium sp.]
MFRSLVVAALLSSAAFAQGVPTKLSFTARLVDAGAPVQGNRDFVFKLYPTVVGGTDIWTETRNGIAVVDGAVNVELGAATPLTETIFDGQTLYLEVTVGTQVLAPRTPVVSVPYALRSTVAGQVGTLTPALIQRRVGTGCGAGAAIQAINADGTVVCAATGGANDAGMTSITNITAGAGLTGGGATGNVSLAVSFAGSGAAVTAARSDHAHTGTYLPLGPVLACTGSDKVVGIAASGSVICATDTNTTYTALTNGGLTLSGANQFSLQSCALNQVLVAGAGGTWSCASPPAAGVTSVGGTAPIASSGGTTPSLSLAVCPTAGHVYKMVAGSWACAPDNDSAPTGNSPITVAGNAVSLAPCTTDGDVYKMSGGIWRCLPDDVGSGVVTSVTGSGAISSSGGAAPIISLTGTVPLANGGTGATLAATGGVRQFVKQSSAGAPLTVGTIAPSDLPAHTHLGSDISSGTVGVANGGTGASLSSSGGPGQVIKQTTAGGPLTAGTLTPGDLPMGTQVWATPPSCGSGQILRGIGNDGTPNCVSPAPVDSYFNISVQGVGNTYGAVYVYCLSSSCNIPVTGSSFYATGSSTGTVAVVRNSVGNYTVTFPWIGSTAVSQVTAYGGNPGVICKMSSFTGPNFTVLCYNLIP